MMDPKLSAYLSHRLKQTQTLAGWAWKGNQIDVLESKSNDSGHLPEVQGIDEKLQELSCLVIKDWFYAELSKLCGAPRCS